MRTADHTVLIAFLATGAALLAAVIAAGTADIRQRRQLQHDRQLHDLAELRSVLDAATVALADAITAQLLTFSGVGIADIDPEFRELLGVGPLGQRLADDRQSAEARDKMILIGQRLAIRLGHDDPVVGAYDQAIRVVIQSITQTAEKRRAHKAGGQVSTKDFNESVRNLRQAQTEFVTLAVQRAGSRLG
jgi:hypothetical protein